MTNKTPTRASTSTPERQTADSKDVQAFLESVRKLAPSRTSAGGKGRIILALDATMSRQPTWDLACTLQAQMFDAVGQTNRLEVQLVYFRGFAECRASKFVDDTDHLKSLMSRIDCRGGHTQIGKVLTQAQRANDEKKVNAVVYIGDAMEENIDDLADKAGRLGLAGTPVFLFQEGHDPAAERAFREIARLTRGAWFRFDRSSADTLARLLSSIAVYATGGLTALTARGNREDQLLLGQLKRDAGK